MSDLSIVDGVVVAFHYTLSNDEGEVISSSLGKEPLTYLHGTGGMVPGLERALVGKRVGDKFDAVLPPADGYGERDESNVQVVPRSSLPDADTVAEGDSFIVQTNAGAMFPVWVTKLTPTSATVDPNHPLSGLTLSFAVEVVTVREATDEEREHAHAHGPGGVHE